MKMDVYVLMDNGMYLQKYSNQAAGLLPKSIFCDTITQALAAPKDKADDGVVKDLQQLADCLGVELAIATIDVEVRDLKGNAIRTKLEQRLANDDETHGKNKAVEQSSTDAEEKMKQALGALFDALVK